MYLKSEIWPAIYVLKQLIKRKDIKIDLNVDDIKQED